LGEGTQSKSSAVCQHSVVRGLSDNINDCSNLAPTTEQTLIWQSHRHVFYRCDKTDPSDPDL